MANGVRDLAPFDLGLDSKLRGCDLVKLRIGDVTIGRSIRSRCMVVQQKAGRPVQFEITDACKESLIAWLETRGAREDDWIFPSRSNRGGHLTTRQYGRLVDEWVELIGLDPGNYGTHSMRRTKVALIYKKTGNLRACQLLLGRRQAREHRALSWRRYRGRHQLVRGHRDLRNEVGPQSGAFAGG